MIQDLDDTIKELLVQKVPIDTAVTDISFDMPTGEWETALTKPTVDVYLYDVRENHELRSNERYLSRAGGYGTETRAPHRIDLTYLITAWTTDVSDEHRLLGGMLNTLLRYPIIPEEVYKGTIVNQSLPLHAWIAQPDRTPNVWDFWGSLGSRLKAGISYMVTLAVEPFAPEEVGLATEKYIEIKLAQ